MDLAFITLVDGKATEISWYISGKIEMVSPVRASVDVSKRIATKVVDHQIASGNHRRGTGQISEAGVFSTTLLSFVLYNLLHAHEVPARQG